MTRKTEKATVLIVEDERNAREALVSFLKPDYDITVAEDGVRAINILKKNNFDIVLTDLIMPGADGFQVLEQCLKKDPQPSCIVISAYGSAENGFEAKSKGAEDFITKPINLDHLQAVLNKVLEKRRLKNENIELKRRLLEKDVSRQIIGNSPQIQEVMETIRQVATARTTVLICGESGTGKELVARALHDLSGRKGPFVAVHCAALPPTLLESELFGHEKGAFTGAIEQRKGRFELADGGTLFLDEISEIDASVQIKILRVLETRSFERVGGNETIYTDVRVVAATNKDLKALVQEGKFREDLFFRLFVVTITLPPLRERRDDIPLLVKSFIAEFAKENGKNINGITEEALNALCAYHWPGNVRELRNAIERMVVMCRGDKLDIDNVPPHIREKTGILPTTKISYVPTTLNLAENERILIQKALEQTNGNISKAAELLGISRRTLHRKLKELEELKK